MPDRLPGQSPALDPTPWVFRLRHIVEPFASPRHPGWRDFFASVERRHNALTAQWVRSDSVPEEFRDELIRLAFAELVEQPEDELTPEAQHYLSTPFGIIESLTTGLCLADPSKDRAEIEKQVGSLTYPLLREVYVGPPEDSPAE